MLQRVAGIDTGYTRSIAAGIRPMYLRARDRGYIRGYERRAAVKKIPVIQIVSACCATPAGGATHPVSRRQNLLFAFGYNALGFPLWRGF
jgi:hypothetical protein